MVCRLLAGVRETETSTSKGWGWMIGCNWPVQQCTGCAASALACACGMVVSVRDVKQSRVELLHLLASF